MVKLKLGVIDDDKPVKVSIELPASVHRDLVAYSQVLARETGRPIGDPVKLMALQGLDAVGIEKSIRAWSQ